MEITQKEKEFYNLRLRIGLHCNSHGPTSTARAFRTGTHVNKYWRKKITVPNFHNKRWGGSRYTKFGRLQPAVHALIWAALKNNPLMSVPEVCEWMETTTGFELNTRYVVQLFKKWNWSTKKPVCHQINKYKISNIKYYCDFLYGIMKIPWKNLKFLDECHFIAKQSYKSKIWCPKGHNIILLDYPNLDVSYTLTFMTNLQNVKRPFWAGIRKKSNNQYTFLSYIYSAIINKQLCPGDYLICDNSSIHWAEATQQVLGT